MGDAAKSLSTPPRRQESLQMDNIRFRTVPRGPRIERVVRNLFRQERGPKLVCRNIHISEGLSASYHPDLDITYFTQLYTKIGFLGSGSFGIVHKVKFNDDGQIYAIKESRFRRHRTYALKEVENFEKVGYHANCVAFLSAWEEDKIVYIKMEFCNFSLAQYLAMTNNESLDELQISEILFDILQALVFLHGRNLIHFDVKPANMLISKGGFYKLADFGLLLDLNQGDEMITVVSDGDPKYLAREVLDHIYTPACDIFALGISVLELTSADRFSLPSEGNMWQSLRCDIISRHFFERQSRSFKYIVKDMIRQDYRMRPSSRCLLDYPMVRRMRKPEFMLSRQNRFRGIHLEYGRLPILDSGNLDISQAETPSRPLRGYSRQRNNLRRGSNREPGIEPLQGWMVPLRFDEDKDNDKV